MRDQSLCKIMRKAVSKYGVQVMVVLVWPGSRRMASGASTYANTRFSASLEYMMLTWRCTPVWQFLSPLRLFLYGVGAVKILCAGECVSTHQLCSSLVKQMINTHEYDSR